MREPRPSVKMRPTRTREDDRDAVVVQARQKVVQARQKDAHAFTPWTKEEEQEIRRPFEVGESIPAIARSRKRSLRAIELRLQRPGLLPAA